MKLLTLALSAATLTALAASAAQAASHHHVRHARGAYAYRGYGPLNGGGVGSPGPIYRQGLYLVRNKSDCELDPGRAWMTGPDAGNALEHASCDSPGDRSWSLNQCSRLADALPTRSVPVRKAEDANLRRPRPASQAKD